MSPGRIRSMSSMSSTSNASRRSHMSGIPSLCSRDLVSGTNTRTIGMFLVVCTAFFHRRGMGHPCGFPGRPRNGSSITATPISRPGDTVQYSCRPGFTMFGDEERVCLESGIWAGRQPICELNLVLEHPALMSAQLWNYKPSLAVDGNSETCSFTPRTSEQRWWQVDLMAQQHIGSVALIISQDSYHELTIFVIELVSRSEALYKPCTNFKGRFPNSRMLFSCNKGKGHTGRYVYVRDDRKDHDYFGLCEVEVFAYRDGSACGEPEQPVASRVVVLGDTAIYSCLPGHHLVDSPNRTCEQGGHWTGHSPQCRPISCAFPPELEHSEVELLNQSTTWNSEATYSCKAGYTFPHGPQLTIQCLDTGQWESVNLTCAPDDDSRQQLAVKSREKVLTDIAHASAPGTTHTVVSAGIVSSVMLAVVAAIGVVLIRRHQARSRFDAERSPSSELGGPSKRGDAAASPATDADDAVLYTVVETSRSLGGSAPQAAFVGAKDSVGNVSPEILALYAQIDVTKKKSSLESDRRESCKVSNECDCSRYSLAEDLARFSMDGHPGVVHRVAKLPVPQVCLLPASKHQIVHTVASDKL